MQIRTASPEDADKLLEIYRPHIENSTTSFEYEVPSVQDFQQRIQAILPNYPYLVSIENDHILGYAYAHPYGERKAYQWSSEVSVYIGKDAQGKGVGRRLYETIEDILKQQNVVNVTACVTSENENSIAFHQHMGYEITAKFDDIGFKNGKWIGTYWLKKVIGRQAATQAEKPQQEPAPFIPFSKLI
ncbi:N-acetyltransferase [Fructobacillus sp. M2-14]|uniref:N-acetyltransferase n=1 Tax=Fructobacillus broussonetiae TaxID=2713173 RepID=A0ABS5QY79_9LACO|nr:GNAT family N-acetyltransferase [Fructobacillus broussonetiae]MBS9338158.1 N-acetyltransferase [Fructobacillus broussonetiae]